jgi:transposase
MRSKVERHSEEAEKTVRDIRRATRRQYPAEEKVRIVIAGLRGEESVSELCRKEGINQNLYYRWSKDFLEAGKTRLAGDTAREATSDEVKGLRAETHQLKGDEMLEYYAFIFCQGGFRPLDMTFEQFLLVAAAIKPADLPATREEARTF